MPIPQQVISLLDSFEILTPAPGTQVTAGTPLTPTLNVPDPQAAFGVLLQPEKIADLNLDLDLTDIVFNVTTRNVGATNFDVVLKGVEFPGTPDLTATEVQIGETAAGKLPHLVLPPAVPPSVSPNQQGLLGVIEGTIKPIEQLTGRIAGTIVGSITKAVLTATPTVMVSWRIEDSSGRPLDATQVQVTGLAPTPTFTLLPVFTELTNTPPLSAERRILCTISVTVGTETVTRTLGPVTVQMPQIPVPTMMILTEHATTDPRFPGRWLIGIPRNSALGTFADFVGQLRMLAGALSAFPALPAFAPFAAAAAAIGMWITPGAGTSIAMPATHVKEGDWQDNMFYWFEGSFNGLASSLLMIGPPGRRLRLYVAERDAWPPHNFVERRGSLNVTLGLTAVVAVPNFAVTTFPPGPDVVPGLGSTVTVGNSGGLTGFNDQLRSYKFLAATEV